MLHRHFKYLQKLIYGSNRFQKEHLFKLRAVYKKATKFQFTIVNSKLHLLAIEKFKVFTNSALESFKGNFYTNDKSM